MTRKSDVAESPGELASRRHRSHNFVRSGGARVRQMHCREGKQDKHSTQLSRRTNIHLGELIVQYVEMTRAGCIRPAGVRHCRVSLPPAMHCVKGALSATLGGRGGKHATQFQDTRALSLYHQLHPTLLRPRTRVSLFEPRQCFIAASQAPPNTHPAAGT